MLDRRPTTDATRCPSRPNAFAVTIDHRDHQPCPCLGPQPELNADTIDQICDQLERRWINESIPALGGLTPLQCVADPTRRRDVERLIASFPPTPAGMISQRPERLRSLLGLNAT